MIIIIIINVLDVRRIYIHISINTYMYIYPCIHHDTYMHTNTQAGAVPGGYSAKFYPSGTDVAVATDSPWINWKNIGW